MLDYLIAHGKVCVRRVGRRVLIPRTELEKFASNLAESASGMDRDGTEK
jgi:hypothetical protein